MMTQEERDALDAETETKKYGVDFPNSVKEYRNTYMEQEISYTNEGEDTFTALNTSANRSHLAGLELRWKTENTIQQINFKNNDDTIVSATLADIQGLEKEMFLREQAGRNAEAVVLANHSQTPYTDDTWKTDFDTEVAS